MKFSTVYIITCCTLLMSLQAHPQAMVTNTCTVIPPIFGAIYANNLERVIEIVSKNHDIIYSFYRTKTPIQYALECNSIDIFKYLLAQDSWTHISGNTTLLLQAVEEGKVIFIKTLISSGKLLCQHSKECDPTLEAFKNLPTYSQLYQQAELSEMMRLITYASFTKESLCEKLPSKSIKNNNYLELKKWISQECPLQDSKKFSFMAFYCPVLSETFANMFTANIISLSDLAQLQQIDFEYALMARNTRSIFTLRQKLLENSPYEPENPLLITYEPANSLLIKMDSAFQTLKVLWEPYFKELEDTTSLLKKEHNFWLQRNIIYKNILNKKTFSDIIFITLP